MQSNRMLKAENADLRSSVTRLSSELNEARKSAAPLAAERALSIRQVSASAASGSVRASADVPITPNRPTHPHQTTAEPPVPTLTRTRQAVGEQSQGQNTQSTPKSVPRKAARAPPLVSLLSSFDDVAEDPAGPVSSTLLSSQLFFPARPSRPPSAEEGNVRLWWQYAASMAAGRRLVGATRKSVRGGRSASRTEPSDRQGTHGQEAPVATLSAQAFTTPERPAGPRGKTKAKVVKPEGHRSTLVKPTQSPQERGASGLLLPSSAFAKYLAGSISNSVSGGVNSGAATEATATPTTPEDSSDGTPKPYLSRRSASGLLIPSPQLAKYINSSNRQASL